MGRVGRACGLFSAEGLPSGPVWSGFAAAVSASASAGAGAAAFSSAVCASPPSAGGSDLARSSGIRRMSDSRWWCSSRSFRVRRASTLVVFRAALANSPAARVCSLMATVEFAAWVASAAARA